MKKIKGFTLVELMIAFGLMSFVLTFAFAIWSRVTNNIARSTTLHMLQSELRKIANYMQKDLRSIKAGTFKVINTNEEGTAFEVAFQIFTDIQEGKLAEEAVATITYKLENSILKRIEASKRSFKILGYHVDNMRMEQAVKMGDFATDNALFEEGSKACINVSIEGKTLIPGSNKFIYHSELTSVVMRDEFYKNTNKSYKSNFELASLDKGELDYNDESHDDFFKKIASLTEDFLKGLSEAQVKSMLDEQTKLKDELNKNINSINDSISKVDTNEGWLGIKNIFSSQDHIDIRSKQQQLAKTNNLKECQNTVNELNALIKNKDDEFFQKSLSSADYNKYKNGSEEEKQIYKKAYELRVNDLLVTRKQEKADADKIKAEAGIWGIFMNDEVKNLPVSEDGKGKNFKDIENLTKEKFTVKDVDGNFIEQVNSKETQEYNKKLLAAYNSIQVGWLDEKNDKRSSDDKKMADEYEFYSAAKTISSIGSTKISMLEDRDQAVANINVINEFKKNKGKN